MISGLSVNRKKSGLIKGIHPEFSTLNKFKYLGINFKVDSFDTSLITPYDKDLCSSIKKTATKYLPFAKSKKPYIRSYLFNSMISSKLIHYLRCFDPSDELNKVYLSIVKSWFPRIRDSVLFSSKPNGGLGIIHLDSFSKALHQNWIPYVCKHWNSSSPFMRCLKEETIEKCNNFSQAPITHSWNSSNFGYHSISKDWSELHFKFSENATFTHIWNYDDTLTPTRFSPYGETEFLCQYDDKIYYNGYATPNPETWFEKTTMMGTSRDNLIDFNLTKVSDLVINTTLTLTQLQAEVLNGYCDLDFDFSALVGLASNCYLRIKAFWFDLLHFRLGGGSDCCICNSRINASHFIYDCPGIDIPWDPNSCWLAWLKHTDIKYNSHNHIRWQLLLNNQKHHQ